MLEPPLSIGDHAPDVVLRDQDDQPVSLASTWVDGPVVLVFLRHFG